MHLPKPLPLYKLVGGRRVRMSRTVDVEKIIEGMRAKAEELRSLVKDLRFQAPPPPPPL
jgi:hypothetical protein